MNDFLPKGETIPEKPSLYTKLIEKENRFRVLDSASIGFELWVEGKPIRKKSKDEFTTNQLANADINKFTGKKRIPEYFWAFPIFNYRTEQVEIIEIRQVTIMRGMEDYLQDVDYGKDPKKYDFVVIKDNAEDRTEYRVKAKPPNELDPGITKLYKDMNIRIEAIFDNDGFGTDPFSKEGVVVDNEEVAKALK